MTEEQKPKQNKHAYLIMAHHQFNLLKELIAELDRPYYDIYLHVDAKSSDFSEDEFRKITKYARLFILPRMDIHWGGYSQIQCILNLLETASNTFAYSYYHFLVGVEFPIKEPEYIYDFFEKNSGKEFLGFDKHNRDHYEESVKYYHPFNESGRSITKLGKAQWFLMRSTVKLQKLLNFNCYRSQNYILEKGSAQWSITDKLARYILSQSAWIEKNFRHSICGDEVFLHTLAYNEPTFRDNIYDINDEYHSNMRIDQWKTEDKLLHWEDMELLLTTPYLFARKFSGEEGLEMVRYLQANRSKEQIWLEKE